MTKYKDLTIHILDDDKRFKSSELELGDSLTIFRRMSEACAAIKVTPKVDVLFLDGYLDSGNTGSDYINYLDLHGCLSKIDKIVLISSSRSINYNMQCLLITKDPKFKPSNDVDDLLKLIESDTYNEHMYLIRNEE